MRSAGPGQSRTLPKEGRCLQMNTKSLLTRIGVPVLSLGLLGGIGATLATSASAAPCPATLSASVTPSTATVVHRTNVPGTGTTSAHRRRAGPTTTTTEKHRSTAGLGHRRPDRARSRVTPLGNNEYVGSSTVNGTFEARSPTSRTAHRAALDSVNGSGPRHDLLRGDLGQRLRTPSTLPAPEPARHATGPHHAQLFGSCSRASDRPSCAAARLGVHLPRLMAP